MQEEILEILREIFQDEIENIIENVKNMNEYFSNKENLKKYAMNKAESLVYEVKIRNSGRKISKYLNKKGVNKCQNIYR